MQSMTGTNLVGTSTLAMAVAKACKMHHCREDKTCTILRFLGELKPSSKCRFSQVQRLVKRVHPYLCSRNNTPIRRVQELTPWQNKL